MIFLSTLLRQSVCDLDGHRLGTLKDVCVSLHEAFPVVTALVVSQPSLTTNDLLIPWSQVDNLEEEGKLYLTVKQSQVSSYTPYPEEILLKRDILDKQIVDTQGFRVVKVNDLKLAQIKGTARLIGVDISLSGLLRRLGAAWLLKALPVRLDERIITWNYVEPLQVVRSGVTGQLAPALAGAGVGGPALGIGGVIPQVQLNVSHTKLAELRPADIADILEQLDADEAGAVLDRLAPAIAADTLNEVENPLQAEILSELDPERASDLLEMLPPDDAADILADMPQQEAERLLSLMPLSEAQPIRDLLRYGAQTAGGIMTTEVLALAQDLTVEEALAYLREHSEHLEMIYYLYIVDSARRLIGIVSLRELVIAPSGTRLQELMDRDVLKVSVDADQEEVARLIAKYDLLGVPVVDSEERLVGLITVDDVIDVIHEEQAEDFSEMAGASVEELEEEEHFSLKAILNRITWLGVNVVAGFLIALIFYGIFGRALIENITQVHIGGLARGLRSPVALSGVICLTPMLLLTSGSVGSQALGVADWQLRSAHGLDFWRAIFRELRLGAVGGILASIVIGLFTWLLFRSWPLGVSIGLSLGLTLLLAALGGLILPAFLQRLRLQGSLVSAPLLDPLIAILSLSTFLIVALWLLAVMSF
ncbi:MAG TPA: magnesium transporter [Ktedonobacteraceae bacterium]|nr:magnesium transporter [Ktedonobacteraceae bacterium]